MSTVPNLTPEEIAAFEGLQSQDEARALCDAIKARRGGAYPPDWWQEMKLSGRMDRVYARWGSDSQIRVTTDTHAIRTVGHLIDELVETVNAIDRDERFHYPNATVVENAPLALVQLNMETRVAFAQEILRRVGYEGPALAVRKGPRP